MNTLPMHLRYIAYGVLGLIALSAITALFTFADLGKYFSRPGGAASASLGLPASCVGPAKIYTAAAPSGGDDGPALQALIDTAVAELESGVTTRAEIQLKAKATYRLDSRVNRYDSLHFKGSLTKPKVRCLEFNGQGARLTISPLATGIYIGNCVECAFHDFTLKMREEAGTQGEVVNVHLPEGSGDQAYVDIRVHDDFPLFDIPKGYVNSRSVEPGKRIIAVAHAFAPGLIPNHLTYDYGMRSGGNRVQPYFPIDSATVLSRPDRTLRVYTSLDTGDTYSAPGGVSLLFPKIVPGQTVLEFIRYFDGAQRIQHLRSLDERVVQDMYTNMHNNLTEEYFVGNSGRAIHVDGSSDTSLSNITITNYQGSGIQLMGNMGQITLDGITIAPSAPGHLLSIASDGIHANNNRVGPIIRNSRIENADDDSVNLSSAAYAFLSIDSDSMGGVVSSSKRPFPVLVGDRFGLYSSKLMKRGEYVVTSVTNVTPNRYAVRFSKKLPPKITPLVDTSSTNVDVLVNYNMANSGAIIENNVFLSNMRGGVLVDSGATIRNNHFIGLGNAAVLYSRSNAGPRVQIGDEKAVIVDNNTVIDTNAGLLDLGRGLVAPQTAITEPMIVRNNTVVAPRHWVVSRANTLFQTPVVANNNVVYTNGKETMEELLQDPLWTSDPLTVVHLSKVKLANRRQNSSPIPSLDLTFAQQYFFGEQVVAALPLEEEASEASVETLIGFLTSAPQGFVESLQGAAARLLP